MSDREPRMTDYGICNEVIDERVAQDAKWGIQNHANGTGNRFFTWLMNWAKRRCDRGNPVKWEKILTEEVCESYAESDPVRLREELIQSAAVIVNWVGAIDRKARLYAQSLSEVAS
jgi:hypothetical protein